jgi:hypothetical protein
MFTALLTAMGVLVSLPPCWVAYLAPTKASRPGTQTCATKMKLAAVQRQLPPLRCPLRHIPRAGGQRQAGPGRSIAIITVASFGLRSAQQVERSTLAVEPLVAKSTWFN